MNHPSTLSARMKAFRDRTLAYQELGYDRFGAARLVAEMAGQLHGVALDVGTGKAVMASTLAAFCGVTVVTVDVDDSERDLAELVTFKAGMRDRVRFMQADAANLPFADEHFGSAVMMDALHHMADAAGVLREIARVVTPGSTIVVADFTEEGFRILEEVLGSHQRCGITMESVSGLAEGLGLKTVLRAEGFMHQVAVFRKK